MAKTAAPAERAAELRKQLDHHNHLYYVEARTEISDRDFDKLLQELADLEKQHPELASRDSPTQRVGGAPIPGFAKVTHKLPMLSIENSYDEADLRKFDADVRKALGKAAVEYVVELKIDGVSMSITYEGGQLAFGATRGSGGVGDNVTHNLKTIAAIPLKLAAKNPPPLFETRGEVYMTKTEFARVNKEESKKRAEPHKNPRNLTAGTLKLLDPKECARRKMQFFAYGLGATDGVRIQSQTELMVALKAFGFPVNPHAKLCSTIDDVIAYCNEWKDKRRTLDYETDGMVIKVNDFTQRERLGVTAKVPRWAKAYKFEAEQGVTKLGAVVFHIGKFGELTPVATFDPPVDLSGSTITHASMHNAAWVAEKDVRIGDTVVIEKKGEIIPQVVDVIKADRKGTEKVIAWPDKCPEVRRAGGEGRDRHELQLHLREHRRVPGAARQAARRLRPPHPHGHRRPRPRSLHSTGRFRAGEIRNGHLPPHQEATAHAGEVRRLEGAEPARRDRCEQGPRAGAAAAGAHDLHGRREHGGSAGGRVSEH